MIMVCRKRIRICPGRDDYCIRAYQRREAGSSSAAERLRRDRDHEGRFTGS